MKPGYLSTAQWSESEVDKIEKDFKLTTTKYTSLTNIHLYNEHNTITKYNDVETIMRDYAEVRLKLYAKRKEYQLSNLDHEINVISAKCKFILDIIEESIIIQKRTKQNILEQLESREYPKFNESYDYLIKLPIYTLSQEEIDRLLKEKGDLMEDYKDLQDTSIEELWLVEMKVFEKMYCKFLKK